MSKPAVHAEVPSEQSDVAIELSETTEGFAARLREATKSVHREAERTGFIFDLIRGRATRAGYVAYLRNLVPIYAALETALGTHTGAASHAAFAQPGLRRLSRLRDDLDAFERGYDLAPAPILPEAEAYARAIEAAASDDSARLVAHAYARYLGDLSGGQILKPILARSLQLKPEMLSFYDFPDIADVETTKNQMRAALDSVPATSPVADRIVTEAVVAFRHNIALSSAVVRACESTSSDAELSV